MPSDRFVEPFEPTVTADDALDVIAVVALGEGPQQPIDA